MLAAFGDAPAKLTRDDAQKLKSPVANTKKSIDRGRVIFMQNCTSCHGENGKAEGSLIADATDLTSPEALQERDQRGRDLPQHSRRRGRSDARVQIAARKRNRHLEFGEFRSQPVAGIGAAGSSRTDSK